MKTVYVMRHGKSKRGPQYHTDFERPLAKRGKRDAVRIGAYLADNDLLPDLILSSAAQRARDTASRLVDAADYQGELRILDTLYFTDDGVYLELLWGLEDGVGAVMFVGHNPASESVVETLSGEYARLPTAAMARIDFQVDRWADVNEGQGRLIWVLRPKEMPS
jgi:phosphohistidine phosphatase